MSYTEKAQQFVDENKKDDDNGALNSSIRNLAVGLTPTLMNFLSNRSAQMKARGFEKGNKYLQDIGNQKTTEVDIDGEPIIMPEGEALFRKPYQKKGFQQNDRLIGSKTMVNLDTNEVVQATQTRNGFVNSISLDPLDPTGRWVEYKTPDIKSFKNYEGGQSLAKTDKYSGKTKTEAISKGIGTDFGGISKEEAMYAMDRKKESNKAELKLNDSLIGVDTAIETLSNPRKMTTQSAAAAYQYLAKAMNKDRLTDEDYERIIGSSGASYGRAIENWVNQKFTGTPSDYTVMAFKAVAEKIRDDIEMQMKSIGAVYKPNFGKNKKAEKKYKDLSGSFLEENQKNRDANKFEDQNSKIESMIKMLKGLK